MDKFKFELGQIVRHRSLNGFNPKPLLIIARGVFESESGKENTYVVSFVKDTMGDLVNYFCRSTISESELEELKKKE